MKIQQRLMAILTAAFLLSGCVPIPVVRADQQPEYTIESQDSTAAHDGNTSEETHISESVAEPSPSESGEKTTEDEEDMDKASQSESVESVIETTEETDDTDKASQSDSAAGTTEEKDDKLRVFSLKTDALIPLLAARGACSEAANFHTRPCA